jgi:hypothetical protein
MLLTLSRTVVSLLALVFLALVIVRVPQTYAADPAQSSRTKIKMLTPFGVKGLSEELQITDKASGKCFAASAASSMRPDAWRCSAGNAILVPATSESSAMRNNLHVPSKVPGPKK